MAMMSPSLTGMDRPAACDEAGPRLAVEHCRPPRVERGERQRHRGHALVARPQEQGQAAHHAVPRHRDVGQSLARRRGADGRRRAQRRRRSAARRRGGIEVARALRHHRRDHVARPPHRLRQLAVLGPRGVEEDAEGGHARPGRRLRGGARRRRPQRVEGARVERARPLRQRAVLGQQRPIAPLVDADDDGAPCRLAHPRLEEQVGGGDLRRGEDAPVGGQDEGEGDGEHQGGPHHPPRARKRGETIHPAQSTPGPMAGRGWQCVGLGDILDRGAGAPDPIIHSRGDVTHAQARRPCRGARRAGHRAAPPICPSSTPTSTTATMPGASCRRRRSWRSSGRPASCARWCRARTTTAPRSSSPRRPTSSSPSSGRIGGAARSRPGCRTPRSSRTSRSGSRSTVTWRSGSSTSTGPTRICPCRGAWSSSRSSTG